MIEVRFVGIVDQPCCPLFSPGVSSMQCDDARSFATELEWNSQIGMRSLIFLNRVADELARILSVDNDCLVNPQV